jgi:MFS family permease
MALLGLLNSVSAPAIQAFIGFRWKEKHAGLFTIVHVSNNTGIAIGTSLAGVLASISFSFTFLFNSLSTIGFALLNREDRVENAKNHPA